MKIFKYILLAAAVISIIACNEKNEENNEPAIYSSITLETSLDHMVANGIDKVKFTVFADSVDVTKYATIYDQNNQEVTDAVFSTTTPGTYKFWAAVGVTLSNTVTVEAIEQPIPEIPADPQPESTDFVQRTLILQFTGTDCPNCPKMINALDLLAADSIYGDKFYLGACHTYNYDDPMYLNNSILDGFNPSRVYPHVVVNFTKHLENYSTSTNLIQLKKAIDDCLETKTKAGLAANAELTGNTLVVSAELKAVTAGNYSIGCWLLEDGIYAYQSGSKGYITHNNAIRMDCKPYNGNSLGSVEAGQTAKTLFTFNMKEEWVKENCHLIVFACYTQGNAQIITNAISVPLNTSVPYQYNQ